MVILFDQFNLSEDIFDTVFATPQQKIVGKVLVGYMKENGNEITKTEMSYIANQLHEGNFVTTLEEPEYRGKQVKLKYNKRQFYDRIVTPFRTMGIIEYDLYKKTYKLSENFNKLMMKIGLMWLKELRRPVNVKLKSKKK